MPFQVTTVTTPQTDPHITFTQYLTTLDSSVFDPDYPEYAGQSPDAVITNFVSENIYNPDNPNDVIEENTVIEANGQVIITQLFSSEESYNITSNLTLYETPVVSAPITGKISCSDSSPTVTGIDTLFTNTCTVDGTIYSRIDNNNNDYYLIGKIASITSDTELVLKENASYNVTNQSYYQNPKLSVLTYLMNMYETAYPQTVTINFANV